MSLSNVITVLKVISIRGTKSEHLPSLAILIYTIALVKNIMTGRM
jgi:hypothetical protein